MTRSRHDVHAADSEGAVGLRLSLKADASPLGLGALFASAGAYAPRDTTTAPAQGSDNGRTIDSGKSSGNAIRGLPFARSEFNGRTAFAAGVDALALNSADVPSELLGFVRPITRAAQHERVDCATRAVCMGTEF